MKTKITLRDLINKIINEIGDVSGEFEFDIGIESDKEKIIWSPLSLSRIKFKIIKK